MRRLLVVGCLGVALAGCGAHPAPAGSPDPLTTAPRNSAPEVAVPSSLSPRGEESVAEAKAGGVPTVTLTIATDQGRAGDVVAALERLGATVEASDAATGHVRAVVPVDLAVDVPALSGVKQVDVDQPLSNRDPEP
ncbi:hypothetical protein [Saccharothrix sp. Mg75]|uniref:hypothetical protein n=1 Tax=Saccharothrix sp. Mg75 TaxID=3445357 RepID=UPI003EEC8671